MRTITPVMIVMCIGLAGAMVSGAGLADAWGTDPPQTAAAQEQLNKNSDRVDPQGTPVKGPVSSGDSDLVGVIVNGITSLVKTAAAVAVMPVTLMNLSFPIWFAVPVGSFGTLLVGIGIVEFASNREWT